MEHVSVKYALSPNAYACQHIYARRTITARKAAGLGVPLQQPTKVCPYMHSVRNNPWASFARLKGIPANPGGTLKFQAVRSPKPTASGARADAGLLRSKPH